MVRVHNIALQYQYEQMINMYEVYETGHAKDEDWAKEVVRGIMCTSQ